MDSTLPHRRRKQQDIATISDGEELLSNLERLVLTLLSTERRRSLIDKEAPYVFAIDSDLLFTFVYNEGNCPKLAYESNQLRQRRQIAQRAVESILLAHDQQFTLLPITIEDMAKTFQLFANKIAMVDFAAAIQPIAGSYNNPSIERAKHFEHLKEIRELGLRLARLESIFLAPNLISFQEIPLSTDMRIVAVQILQELDHISSSRNFPARSIDRLLYSAQHLAQCVASSVRGWPICFVMSFPPILEWAKKSEIHVGEIGYVRDYVLAPDEMLAMLGLRHSTPSEISSLYRAAKSATDSVQQTLASGIWKTPSLPSKVDDLLHQISALAKVAEHSSKFSEGWDTFWNSPIDDEPSLDIEVLAALVHKVCNSAKKQLTNALANLGRSLGLDNSKKTAATQKAELGISMNTMQLLCSATHNSRVTFSKLIINTETLNMREYNITQNGSNLSLVVDSYKVACDNLSELRPDIQPLLAEFQEEIFKSALPPQEQADVIEVAATAITSVKEYGKLTGMVKIAWTGLKDVLTTAPTALDLWERITKMLS